MVMMIWATVMLVMVKVTNDYVGDVTDIYSSVMCATGGYVGNGV